jgi:N-acetyl sugar amidotransferase
MKYCRRCVLPDTRPGISLDQDGLCSACRGHDRKTYEIDWESRCQVLLRLVEEAKAQAKAQSGGYDCVVPLSGGKDSWSQVIRCQEHGLKVLGVTWRTPGRTPIGQRNLDALIESLGIDHIDYSINPSVERRFMKAAFLHKGATAIPMHMALFAIPIRLAVQLSIPLIVWGENPQLEFGGAEGEQLATDLDLAWVRRLGVTNQTGPDDWIGAEGLTAEDLAAYRLPPEEAFAGRIRSVFLGAFFAWNSFDNAQLARSRGFADGDEHRRTGTWGFADIDDHFISLHHFLKWHKFGLTRAFDNLSVQIRYGMLGRADAIEQLRRLGPQIPHDDIRRFCAFVGESEEWWWANVERFRNLDVWRRDSDGIWRIPGFLIEDWPW